MIPISERDLVLLLREVATYARASPFILNDTEILNWPEKLSGKGCVHLPESHVCPCI